MPRRLVRAYRKHRIININLNLVASGMLAVALAKLPVEWASPWVRRLTTPLPVIDPNFAVTVGAAIIDGLVDVVLYYTLHWLANHAGRAKPPQRMPMPRPDRPRGRRHRGSFFRDATGVQLQRLALSPIYYGVAMLLMFVLTKWNYLSDGSAFVVSFAVGVLTTRVVHTIWGLRTGLFEPDDDPELAKEKTPAA